MYDEKAAIEERVKRQAKNISGSVLHLVTSPLGDSDLKGPISPIRPSPFSFAPDVLAVLPRLHLSTRSKIPSTQPRIPSNILVFFLHVALEGASIMTIGNIQNFIISYSYCLTPSTKAPAPRPLCLARFYDPIIQSISSLCSWLPCSFFSAFLAWNCPQPQRRRCFGATTLPI